MRNNSNFFLIFLAIFFCFLFLSCKEKKGERIKITTELPADFEMYKNSEMAALMREMVAKNDRLKDHILSNKEIGKFDEDYLKIHTAQLTDPSDFDEDYKIFATHFINMQQRIFKADKENLKNEYNNAINACITCHKSKCSGPISRIEKLLIP